MKSGMDALDIFTYVGQRSEDSSTCPSVPGLDLGLDWIRLDAAGSSSDVAVCFTLLHQLSTKFLKISSSS